MASENQGRSGRQIIFRLLAIVAGLAFLILSGQERLRINKTLTVGVAATLEPISGYTTHTKRGSTTYSAEFAFKTAQGELIRKRRSFPEELLSEFQQQRPVKVRYDPLDPSDFVFENESVGWLPPLLGGGFLVAALFVL